MACTPVNSGQGAKRLAAATSDASPPLDASVPLIVADLEGHDLSGLRRRWRDHLGGEPPAHVPRWLLMRVLAYRLQSDAFGGLDKSIQRILRSEKDDDAAAPFGRRAPQTREGVGLRAGAGESVYRISHAAAHGGDHIAAQTDASDGHDGEPKPRANQAA